MICNTDISKNVGYNCNLVGGVEARLYLFNRDQIAAFVRDMVNPQIITDITMAIKTPAVTGPPAVAAILYTGFRYDGFNFSVKPKTAFVLKASGARYDHTVDFVVFGRGSDVKAELEAMAGGSFVAIVENLNKADDNAFEVYGLDVGLQVKTLVDDPTGDGDGSYAIGLGSPDNYKEAHLPATFFDTSYLTSKASLNDLIAVSDPI